MPRGKRLGLALHPDGAGMVRGMHGPVPAANRNPTGPDPDCFSPRT